MSTSTASSGWAGLFATAFKRSQTAMALTDDQRRIIDVNGAMAQLFGYKPSELRGTHTYDHVESGPLISREEWPRAMARGDVTGDAAVRAADGSVVQVQFAVHREVVTGRQFVLFVAVTLSRWGRHFRRESEHDEALG